MPNRGRPVGLFLVVPVWYAVVSAPNGQGELLKDCELAVANIRPFMDAIVAVRAPHNAAARHDYEWHVMDSSD
jgi:hypothetical protein